MVRARRIVCRYKGQGARSARRSAPMNTQPLQPQPDADAEVRSERRGPERDRNLLRLDLMPDTMEDVLRRATRERRAALLTLLARGAIS